MSGADDAQIAVERDKDGIITATVEHMKDDEAGAVIASKLERIELGTDDDGDPITSCVIVESEISKKAGTKLSKAQNFAFDTLEKIIASKDDSITVLPESILAIKGIPTGTRVCKADVWRKQFYDTYSVLDHNAYEKGAAVPSYRWRTPMPRRRSYERTADMPIAITPVEYGGKCPSWALSARRRSGGPAVLIRS